jgi:hypothetical protein
VQVTNKEIYRKAIDELFITIPPGIVEMRDDRTKKNWSVDIGAFKLSKYPVTQDF